MNEVGALRQNLDVPAFRVTPDEKMTPLSKTMSVGVINE
jgi:hypothetical protein